MWMCSPSKRSSLPSPTSTSIRNAWPALVRRVPWIRARVKAAYEEAAKKAGQTPETLGGPAAWEPAGDLDGLVAQGAEIGVLSRKAALGEDVTGLQELVTYGLKGMAAYADHAQILGQEDDAVYAFLHEALDYLTQAKQSVDELVGLALKCGEVNLTVMGLLDAANTGSLRPSRADRGARRAAQGQGHPRSRATISRTWRNCSSRPRARASTSTRTARCCRRTVTRSSRSLPAPGRQLRRRVAGPEEGVRRFPRRDSDDDELHPERRAIATRRASSPAGWWRGRA